MQKIFDYIQDTGALAIIDTIEKPESEFKSLKDVFTKKINELVDVALSEKDYSTFNFLQWYVAAQHEEEKLFKSILDKIDIIGLEGRGLFMIDREIGSIQAN